MPANYVDGTIIEETYYGVATKKGQQCASRGSQWPLDSPTALTSTSKP